MPKVGTVLKGFCNGFFGRDSYEDKVIEAVGEDWVVVRNTGTKMPEFAEFADITRARMGQYLSTWAGEESK